MDKKEIDTLTSRSQDRIAEFSKKQEELLKHLSEKNKTASMSRTGASPKKGKAQGQLSGATEEAEAGTNLVMGYLESVLTVVSRQQDFVKDITGRYNENPEAIDVLEALIFLADNLAVIKESIYNAMAAFQFQDLGRQKLLKVMYTLSKLSEYLNELMGGPGEPGRQGESTGSPIEKEALEHEASQSSDREKNSASVDNSDIDNIIAEFQEKSRRG
jgi:hypothetical protein